MTRDDLMTLGASLLFAAAALLSFLSARSLTARLEGLRAVAGEVQPETGKTAAGGSTSEAMGAVEGALADLENEILELDGRLASLIAAGAGSDGSGGGRISDEAMAELVRKILERQDAEHRQSKTERAIRNVGLTFDVNLRNIGAWLELRDDQKEKVLKILNAELETGAPQILAAASRAEAMPILQGMKDRSREQILGLLDDAQRAKYLKGKIDWFGNGLMRSRPR